MIVRSTSEIYLDANATTAVLPEATQQARDAMEGLYGNPSSSHIAGLQARSMLESSRDWVRQVLGADGGQIVFTSGATEAIQMGVFSTLCEVRERRQSQSQNPNARKILYGATEHKAVPMSIQHWNQLLGVNNELLEIPVNRRGELELDFIRQHAAESDLICTMAVNNETGVITDLKEVEAAIREHNKDVNWLVDCVQAVGKIELNLSTTTITFAPVSGHKMYAPKGIGLLYVREGAKLVPMMAGGGQEHGARGGTENLPGVAAIAAVMQRLASSPSRAFAQPEVLHSFRERLVASLKTAFPQICFNAEFDNTVPTTVNFAVKGFSSKELLDLFDAAGVRVSSGSACGSAAASSYVLEAMGVDMWQSLGAIRLSFGPLIREYEIDAACQRIEQIGQALSQSCLVLNSDVESIAEQSLDGLIQLKNGSMCTWLLFDAEQKKCIVIDPFEELMERAETIIRCQGSEVVAILDTHAHVDHESPRQLMLQLVRDIAADSAFTNDLLGWPEAADGQVLLADGEHVPFIEMGNGRILAQTSLPGHTQIGRALLVGSAQNGSLKRDDIEFAFLGDTILIGGIGRTDFPCSTIGGMYDSLQRLPKIIGETTLICPTHDYDNGFACTLQSEIAASPLLRSVLADPSMSISEFLEAKPKIDAGICDSVNSELACGFIPSNPCVEDAAINIEAKELPAFFAANEDAIIIDVREPQEFVFAQNWNELGLKDAPENIPLTRLAGFIPELISQCQTKSHDVIFLCRTGRRSGVAARFARRIGFTSARNISGGIALNMKSSACVDDEPSQSEYMI